MLDAGCWMLGFAPSAQHLNEPHEIWRTLSESLHGECVTHPLPRVVLSQSHHASRDSTTRGSGWVTHLPRVC
jgi:hypothetical protein